MKDKSAVYIAVNDDHIDKKLAEFINSTNDPHKLTKMFIRERDGVYQFGTKRVYVKTEAEKVFGKFACFNFVSESWRRIFDSG